MRDRKKESRLALLGKAVLANPEATLSELIESTERVATRKSDDRLSQFYGQLQLAEVARSRNVSQQRLNELKDDQRELLKRFERRLDQHEQRLLSNSQSVAADLQRSLEELQVRQAKVEMALEERYNNRPPQIQPVYIPYPPPYAMQQPLPTSQTQGSPSKYKKKAISQRTIKSNFPEDASESMYAPPVQAVRRPFNNQLPAKPQTPLELNPPTPAHSTKPPPVLEKTAAVARPRPTTRRIRKYLLAVFYLRALVRSVRERILRRKAKSETSFSNLYSNAKTFMCDKIIESCQSVQTTMKSHAKEAVEYLSSEDCFKEIETIIGVVVDRLVQLKDLLLKDRTLRTLLKQIVRQNEFLPPNYLTPYEIQRISFSVDFGFLYRTQDTCAFLLGMFILVRGVVLSVCGQPLNLDVVFYENAVAKGMLALLADGFYHLSLQVLQSFREQLPEGNWAQVHENVRYVIAPPLALDGADPDPAKAQCVAGNWSLSLLEFLSKREFWRTCKIRLHTYLMEMAQTLSEQFKSEQSVASRGSRRAPVKPPGSSQ